MCIISYFIHPILEKNIPQNFINGPKHNYQETASTYTYLELCNANQKWKFSRRHWNRSEEMTNFRVVSNVMTPMTFSVWGGPHHLPTNFHTKNALQYLKQAAFLQCTKVSKMCPAENIFCWPSFLVLEFYCRHFLIFKVQKSIARYLKKMS